MSIDMELTKKDTQMAKGIAVLGMVMLHLFCRMDPLPYVPLIWTGDYPLIYYFGLFGDICVPVFCFCSGYAHYLMADAQKRSYPKRIPGKALRFVCNYWVVVVVFSILGLLFDRSGNIPGDWTTFFGNLFIVDMNYNGAWWFVATYLILLVLSPLLAELTRRTGWILLLGVSFIVYFASYMFRFNILIHFDSSLLRWLWDQAIRFGISQFPYFVGMVCRKYSCVSWLRSFCKNRPILKYLIIFGLPTAAFLGHGVVMSLAVAPFTAGAVLAALFLVELPGWAREFFLLLGKHSTNIWLVHMFFYHRLFVHLAFAAKYPLLILAFMLALSFGSSVVIEFLYRPICAIIDRKTTIPAKRDNP